LLPTQFSPTGCIVIRDVDLDWDNFVELNKIFYFILVIHEHVITKFSDLLQFFNSLVVYKGKKCIPLVGPKCTPPSCWRLGLGRNKQS
jgi:hypothetical protein